MMDPVLLLKNSNESTTTSYCVYLLQEVVEFAACVQGAPYLPGCLTVSPLWLNNYVQIGEPDIFLGGIQQLRGQNFAIFCPKTC